MCSSQRPENGADSEWNPTPYRVLMEGRWDPDRFWTEVRAIGQHDARHLAEDRYPECVAIKAEAA